KVLDFGLGQREQAGQGLGAAQAATVAEPLSPPGQVVGTVPYMAPEQIRGDAVDARTDLFALGVILYELAGGRRPFTGASSADVSSSILRDTPAPLASVRADLPADLDRIVGRCLEKAPRVRFQTALDLCSELRRLKQASERRAPTPQAESNALRSPAAPTVRSRTCSIFRAGSRKRLRRRSRCR